MMLPRNTDALRYAKELRKNMTRQERHLWYDCLRDYPLRFRRQEVIGNYIADFFCDKARLVIELDGSQHYDADEQRYDKRRTAYLESLGLRGLRFSNYDVDTNFDGVCQAIYYALEDQLKMKGVSSKKKNASP